MCLKFCEDYFGVHILIIMLPSSWKNILFSRSVESWHAYPYSTCRQVEISFLGMPQIAHFQVEKWKSSLPWEGGPLPHPPPARSLRSLAKIAPPKCFGSLRHCSVPPPPQCVDPRYATFAYPSTKAIVFIIVCIIGSLLAYIKAWCYVKVLNGLNVCIS